MRQQTQSQGFGCLRVRQRESDVLKHAWNKLRRAGFPRVRKYLRLGVLEKVNTPALADPGLHKAVSTE
jgi:hypothetical protein